LKWLCKEDLNEIVAAFVQDKVASERGLFDQELVPEELTQVRMGATPTPALRLGPSIAHLVQ